MCTTNFRFVRRKQLKKKVKSRNLANQISYIMLNNPMFILTQADDCKNDKLKRSAGRRRSKRVDTLRPLYRGIITRTFRFDTSDGGVKLLVHEYMAEAKLAFDIPLQLM